MGLQAFGFCRGYPDIIPDVYRISNMLFPRLSVYVYIYIIIYILYILRSILHI